MSDIVIESKKNQYDVSTWLLKLVEKIIVKGNACLLLLLLCCNSFAERTRSIIDHSEKKAEWYRCLQDEWSRITYADYCVAVPTMATSWILLFRWEKIPHCTSRLDISDTATSAALLFIFIFAVWIERCSWWQKRWCWHQRFFLQFLIICYMS